MKMRPDLPPGLRPTGKPKPRPKPKPKPKPVKPKPPNPAVARLIPREYVGSQGVLGGWKAPPRLDPTAFEWTQNEAGRYFARPRTEFTGLDPQDVATIRDFDKLTELQGQRITDAYGNYATQAGADRDAAANALGTLAKLSSAGFSDNAGMGLSRAEHALPGILGQGAREQSAAASVQTMNALNTLPTVARAEGVTGLERFTAERQGQRKDFLTKLREIQAEQAAAQAEAEMEADRFQREQATTLRGQNLDLLGTLGAQQAGLTEAQLRASTDLTQQSAEHAHDLQIEGIQAQQKAVADQYRTPKALRAAGFTGRWRAKPRKAKGMVLEQGSDGFWYGKPKGSGSSSSSSAAVPDRNTRNRALADIQASVRARIPVEPDDPESPTRGLSATEIAQDIAKEYKVPIVWAYDQARASGFHHREGEWQPPKWKGAPVNARQVGR